MILIHYVDRDNLLFYERREDWRLMPPEQLVKLAQYKSIESSNIPNMDNKLIFDVERVIFFKTNRIRKLAT